MVDSNLQTEDRDVLQDLAERYGVEGVRSCYACGTCAAGCPARRVNPAYNPRKIIRMLVLNEAKSLLEKDTIWLCSSCYTCAERCPQEVKITDLMNVIKNIAVREGYIHPSFVAQMEALNSHGRLYEIGEFDNEKRTKLGLPQIEENAEDTKKLFKQKGVDKLLQVAKEGEE